MKWEHDAACRGAGTHVFFPPSDGRSRRAKQLIARAVAICETCRVIGDCDRMARETGSRGGVFAGRFIPEKNMSAA